MADRASVTTFLAAEIVGVGYEGFRSYLKRGLLGNVGVLPPFYGPNAKAEALYAKRWTWSKFGLPDLCLMRLAKMLMDAGLSFDKANSIVSTHDLWSYFSSSEITQRQVLAVPVPNADSYCVYTEADFDKIMPDHKGCEQVVALVSLAEIHARVSQALTSNKGTSLVKGPPRRRRPRRSPSRIPSWSRAWSVLLKPTTHESQEN
jgi:hypothetical protein